MQDAETIATIRGKYAEFLDDLDAHRATHLGAPRVSNADPRRRDRISAISSLSVSPVARRIDLHFKLLPDNTRELPRKLGDTSNDTRSAAQPECPRFNFRYHF